jgi:hypothetical protein
MKLYPLGISALLLMSVVFAQSKLYGQQQPAGVVTAVEGQAQLTRQASPNPALLRQKDGIFIRDVIDTREKSTARMLFGGKATITMRELSRFEVREETLPGGATRSTVQLNSGALLVNVARQLMKPGDEVIINTNNALAAVRGSMVYVESVDAAKTTFAQLSGEAVLSCPNLATSSSASLKRFTAADITGQGANCAVGAVRNITEELAALLLRPFQLPRTITGEGNGSQIVKNVGGDLGAISNAAFGVGGGPPPPPPPPPVLIIRPPTTPLENTIKLPSPCRTTC